ncbi:hypothetical protein [Pseudomonas azotoformans]|jgi:hypothetical protein
MGNNEYYYVPYRHLGEMTPKEQHYALGIHYHYVREYPARLRDDAAKILTQTLLANPNLDMHKGAIEALVNGPHLPHLMYKVKNINNFEKGNVIGYGIGIPIDSLPAGVKKADDWEVISSEACKEGRFA